MDFRTLQGQLSDLPKESVNGIFLTVDPSNQQLDTESVQEPLPRVGEPVWVQCKGYRCLATIDYKGRWKAFLTGKELPDVIKVLDN